MGESDIYIILLLLFFGGLGALIKDIVEDGCISLPRVYKGKLALGFIGSILVGAAVGYIVDHSFITAFFAGYTGYSTLENLVQNKRQNFIKEIVTSKV